MGRKVHKAATDVSANADRRDIKAPSSVRPFIIGKTPALKASRQFLFFLAESCEGIRH
jgi:hypothetical protein